MKQIARTKFKDEFRNIYDALRYLYRHKKHISLTKTILANVKYFRISDAIKCPIVIGKKVDVKLGAIRVNCEIKPALIRIATDLVPVVESGKDTIIIRNEGLIEFGGLFVCRSGARIMVREGATLSIGNKVNLGHLSKMICYKNISIGDDCTFSWECQIIDTDFHFLYNIKKEKYYPRVKPILINDNVFVGNRCTIGKGTILPKGTIVSCNSNVSGDFSQYDENILIKGNPATFIKDGLCMVSSFYPEEEVRIAQMLHE